MEDGWDGEFMEGFVPFKDDTIYVKDGLGNLEVGPPPEISRRWEGVGWR